MPANPWKDLHDRMTNGFPDVWGQKLVPPPSVQALNGYERRNGSRMPRSYCSS